MLSSHTIQTIMQRDNQKDKIKMAASSTSTSNSASTIIIFIFLLCYVCYQSSTLTCASSSTVKFLPGFQGPLPFHLQTGYVGVDESQVQVFYYFLKSENNPQQDPLLLWLSGGPACTSFNGLLFEIGPLALLDQAYNGSLPSLTLRPQSWTKSSSIIFVDLPVGSGFTYSQTEAAAADQGDWKLVHYFHQFLRNWLIDHPEYLSNELYIGGDSYSGIPIPAAFLEISKANENGVQPRLNIQGYILGNGKTAPTDENYQIPFAHGMALISDELYESLQQNCEGNYVNVDPKNSLCLRDLESFNQITAIIQKDHILYPYCGVYLPAQSFLKRSLFEHNHVNSQLTCLTTKFYVSEDWANDDNVRKALHVRKGTVRKWKCCNRALLYKFKQEIEDVIPYHLNISRKGYRSLIYSGDHDMSIPFLSTQAWIRSLNYSIIDEWRPWLVNGQTAGFTRTYSNKMTFATVKGGGHTAPEFRPEECLAMFSRWISKIPL